MNIVNFVFKKQIFLLSILFLFFGCNAPINNSDKTASENSAIDSTPASPSVPVISYQDQKITVGSEFKISPTILLSGDDSEIVNCSISPDLPVGLTFDSSTCSISGISNVSLDKKLYTVKITNSSGNFAYSTFSINIIEKVLVSQIAVGDEYICTLSTQGEIKCFGENTEGQFGNGTTFPNYTFLDVNNLKGVSSISSGSYTFCYVKDGKVYCSGTNDCGQLGSELANLRYNFYETPLEVSYLSDVTQLSSSRINNCALNSSGQVSCWGSFGYGIDATHKIEVCSEYSSYGDTYNFNIVPTPLKNSNIKFKYISTGIGQACGVSVSGSVYCWNMSDMNPILKDITDTKMIKEGSNYFKSVAVSDSSICALSDIGKIFCWGDNTYGQLGNGTTTPLLSGVSEITKYNNFKSIYAIKNTFCALTTDNKGHCWGYGNDGLLGNGKNLSASTPQDFYPSNPNFIQISGNGSTMMNGLTESGEIYFWSKGMFSTYYGDYYMYPELFSNNPYEN